MNRLVYVFIAFVTLALIRPAFANSMELRTDGIHKITNESDRSFIYIKILDAKQLRWLPEFKGTEEQAVKLLIQTDQVESISYSDKNGEVYFSGSSGSLIGFRKLKTRDDGFFENDVFLVIADGKVVERQVPNDGVLQILRMDGTPLINDSYESVQIINDRFIKVKRKGYYGIVDYAGKSILPAEYDFINEEQEGMVLISKRDMFGFADNSYEIKIPTLYESAGDFYLGIAKVKLNGKWSFIDKTGNLAINGWVDKVWKYASTKMIPIVIDQNKNDVWHFLDMERQALYKFAARTYSVYESLGYTEIYDGKQYILFDKTGKTVVPYAFDSIYVVDPSRFVVRLAGKSGVIDDKAQQVIPIQFNKVSSSVNTTPIVGKYKEGEQKLFSVQKSSQKHTTGVFDYDGHQIAPYEYDRYQFLKEDYVLVSTFDYKKEFKSKAAIYKSGNPQPVFTAEKIENYADGYIAYYEDEEWGIVDLSGNIIVEPDYSEIWVLKNQRFIARDDDEYAILDFDENEIVAFDDYTIKHLQGIGGFHLYEDNTFSADIDITINGEWMDLSLIDSKIKKLVDKDYINIWIMNPEFAIVRHEKGKMGVVDFNGKVIHPIQYKNIVYEPNQNLFLATSF